MAYACANFDCITLLKMLKLSNPEQLKVGERITKFNENKTPAGYKRGLDEYRN
jgi:hypothetical protein